MLVRRLRLWSGLVLAIYVVGHLINHCLGLVSLDAMEAVRRVISPVWHHPIGSTALYGALLLHALLALWALYKRSTLRMPAWEAAQLTLGLLIPPLVVGHVIGTRISAELLGVEITYPHVVNVLWNNTWYSVRQSLLVLVVWGHLAIGLHFWLRLKSWYPSAVPILYPASILLPLLALLGFARAGLSIEALADTPGWLDRINASRHAADPEMKAILSVLPSNALAVMGGLLALTLTARLVRRQYRNRYGSFRVFHPSGRTLQATIGQTLLEAVRAAGVPHASVCGGRGRCTTCRVRVGEGLDELPEPTDVEQRALGRIAAPPNVRLACQTRPRHDVSISPLLPANATARDGRQSGGVEGREELVAVMFIDLRGSTKLGEQRLPYDVVFILNQFFAEMAEALKATRGHYAQFNGDGLMALYGLGSGLEAGCREALQGAVEMLRRMDKLNRNLAHELREPLQIGIGIHSGEAIVGTMGPPTSPIFSAIGDNINVAARLEALTKTYDCTLIVSSITADTAGIDLTDFPRYAAEVRGREAPVPIYAIDDPRAIPELRETAS